MTYSIDYFVMNERLNEMSVTRIDDQIFSRLTDSSAKIEAQDGSV